MSQIKKKRVKKKAIVISIVLVLILALATTVVLYLRNKEHNMKVLANLYFEGLNENQEVGRSVSDIKYNLGCSHVVQYPKIGSKKIDNKIKEIVTKLEDDFINEFGSDKEFNGMEEVSYYQYIDYETYLGPENTMSLIFNEVKESGESNVISEKNYVYNFSIESGELLKDSYLFIGDFKSKITTYLDKYLTTSKDYKDALNSDYKKIINNKTSYRYAITNRSLIVYFDKYEICIGSKGLVKIEIPFSELSGVMNIDINKTTKKLDPNVGANAEKTIYTSSNKKMYVKSLVNFYLKDDKNSKLISYINKGEKVTAIEVGNTGWTKVKYNDSEGYITSSFLSESVVAVEGYTDVDETVYAISTVNIRSKSDANSTKLGSLSRGESVKRVGKSDNGWSEVVYKDDTAYIYSSYLSTTKPSDNTYSFTVNPQRGIDPNKPMVAITFDDGPNPYSTPRILKTLAKYNAVATFFDLGNLIYRFPNVVKQEEAQGCEVGSHTYDHPNLNKLSVEQIQSEMSQSEAAFMKVLGHKPSIVRPPYGSANSTVKATISYPLINWDIDTLDWKSRNKEAILKEFRCTDNYDGKIILMHSIYGTTADAVEVIVPELISKGYQLVTVSELAAYKGVKLQSGHIYYNF